MRKTLSTLAFGVGMALLPTSATAAVTLDTYNITPASGVVTEIASIKLNFPDADMGLVEIIDKSGISLTYTSTDSETTKIYKVVKSDGEWSRTITLYFDENTSLSGITLYEPGTYQLKVPAKAFCTGWPEVYNPEINATYTIAADENTTDLTLTPNPDATDKLYQLDEVKLSFPDASTYADIVATTDGEPWKQIFIQDKGSAATRYNCVEYKINADAGSISLWFAKEGSSSKEIINTPGDYLISVPKGAFAGEYNKDGNTLQVLNNPINATYTLSHVMNNESLHNYVITPTPGTVTQLQGSINITFPDELYGLKYPFNLDGVELRYTPHGETSVTETIKISGNQYTPAEKKVALSFNHEVFTEPGTYTLHIPAGAFVEEHNPEATNEEINDSWIIPAPTMEQTTITISGNKLQDSKMIEVVFDNAAEIAIAPEAKITDITLTFTRPDVTTFKASSCTIDGNKAIVGFEDLTPDVSGECTLNIPAATFIDKATGEPSKDLQKIFDTLTGINTIVQNGDAANDVYNLNGHLIIKGATTSDLQTLPAGIYIIGDRKVAITR